MEDYMPKHGGCEAIAEDITTNPGQVNSPSCKNNWWCEDTIIYQCMKRLANVAMTHTGHVFSDSFIRDPNWLGHIPDESWRPRIIANARARLGCSQRVLGHSKEHPKFHMPLTFHYMDAKLMHEMHKLLHEPYECKLNLEDAMLKTRE